MSLLGGEFLAQLWAYGLGLRSGKSLPQIKNPRFRGRGFKKPASL